MWRNRNKEPDLGLAVNPYNDEEQGWMIKFRALSPWVSLLRRHLLLSLDNSATHSDFCPASFHVDAEGFDSLYSAAKVKDAMEDGVVDDDGDGGGLKLYLQRQRKTVWLRIDGLSSPSPNLLCLSVPSLPLQSVSPLLLTSPDSPLIPSLMD